MTRPTPPIELTGTAERFAGSSVSLDDADIAALAELCDVVSDVDEVADASRDWWPLALHWALAGQVAKRASVVCRPASTAEVAAVLAWCNGRGVPVTPAGGRSSVVGGTVPWRGGVLLDLTAMAGIVEVDAVSGLVAVRAGTFGPDLEDELRERHRLTVGHHPQSMAISTVGGWVACRGAGQYSTRYGKIEDIVAGLEVVLADGTVVHTGGAPRAAVGPDLTQVFVGSEGTLGVVTTVWLRAHPLPGVERTAAYALGSFEAGLEVCRNVLRRGATPAVLRLYDAAESARSHGQDGTTCILLVLDEGEPLLVDSVMAIVEGCVAEQGGFRHDDALVAAWKEHRNDTSALQGLTRKGFVVDTMEIAAPWSRLPGIFDAARSALLAVPHARVATCHLSHSYLDGACLYFTFAATPPADEVESTYRASWDAGTRAVLAGGGNLSHHHGVGLNRSRFVEEALGSALGVLRSIKHALDPVGILNPGKLGLGHESDDRWI